MNVTLVGMPGAGKSYIGKQLAPRLSLEFVDVDSLLERAFGKPVRSILNDLGDERYMEAEADMIINGTSGRSEILIAPGGSILYRTDTLQHVRDMSTVVYLMAPLAVIEERLKQIPEHPIIGLGGRTLRELYDERHPRYAACSDLVIDTSGRSAEEVLESVAGVIAAA
ncbi:MAG: shikimate kinase [bacterium]|nr:shikimate kinase [bacterium]